MSLKRWPAFAPALLAILYGLWLVLTAPPSGFGGLAGVIVIGVGVLAAVLAAIYLIADVYWWKTKTQTWRDVVVGILCIFLSLGGFTLLARV